MTRDERGRLFMSLLLGQPQDEFVGEASSEPQEAPPVLLDPSCLLSTPWPCKVIEGPRSPDGGAPGTEPSPRARGPFSLHRPWDGWDAFLAFTREETGVGQVFQPVFSPPAEGVPQRWAKEGCSRQTARPLSASPSVLPLSSAVCPPGPVHFSLGYAHPFCLCVRPLSSARLSNCHHVSLRLSLRLSMSSIHWPSGLLGAPASVPEHPQQLVGDLAPAPAGTWAGTEQ